MTARSFSNALGTFEKRVPKDARLIRIVLLNLSKEDILANDLDLTLGVRWIKDPRDFFVVDDSTVARLLAVPVGPGPTYPLGAELKDFLD